MSEVTRAEIHLVNAWIRYFDSIIQRMPTMDQLEAISARLASIDPVVARIAAEMGELKAKIDAASVADPRLAAIADHASSILANLQAISPEPAPVEPVADAAAEPVAEQPAQ